MYKKFLLAGLITVATLTPLITPGQSSAEIIGAAPVIDLSPELLGLLRS